MTDRRDDPGAPRRRLRSRFWLEVGLALASVALAVAAGIEPAWIERTTGLHPDSGQGELEWLFAFVPLVAAIGLGWAARVEWRRAVSA